MDTLSWVSEPKVPDIYVGANYLMISGAIAENEPTQKPWKILKMIKE